MRQRSTMTVTAGLLVLATLAVASWLRGTGATEDAQAANQRHMRFAVVVRDAEGTIEPPDFGAAPSVGQQATEDAPVYRDGTKVGDAEIVYTITRIAGEDVAGIIECSVELPEGSLFFNGSFHFGDLATGAVLPVLGGTGRYAGYTGTVTGTVSGDGTRSKLDFDLRKP